ncbi:MAG: hypothetical protein KAT79_00980 [candidate division Zixibacteria bacterium]|nr:hypothetical protein [candidate division Zixibacteria bacterium]
MRAFKLTALLAVAVCLLTGGQSKAGLDFGISIDNDGVKGFYVAIGDHYKVAEKEVVVIKKRQLPDNEYPVVFFIARRVGVSPDMVVKLRLGGQSWMQIAWHFGLDADAFYVPIEGNPGPPYGKAYGHFKKRKKSEWRTIRLSDVEIVNFVNLRFVSEHYGYSPSEVIKLRGGGKKFSDIHKHVKAKKAGKRGPSKKMAVKEKAKAKDKGKGKKK